jgi:1,4-dihydroxy-2-naphthoyl-CoA hydrolase
MMDDEIQTISNNIKPTQTILKQFKLFQKKEMMNQEKLALLNQWNKNTLMETLEIVFTELGDDYLVGTMPVNSRVHQPLGMLHGGANIAFAESLGSCLSNVLVIPDGKAAVGTSINSNHLKSKTDGIVTGTAKIIRKGQTLHFLEIEITDENGSLLCHCTMTNMVINRQINK